MIPCKHSVSTHSGGNPHVPTHSDGNTGGYKILILSTQVKQGKVHRILITPLQSHSKLHWKIPVFSLQCFHQNGWNHRGVKMFNPSTQFYYPLGWEGNWKNPRPVLYTVCQFWSACFTHNWATSWQTNKMAWVPSEDSDHFDQSLHCSLNGQLRSQAFFKWTAKTDQTGRMPRAIWVFAWRTLILLVLSCRGSN